MFSKSERGVNTPQRVAALALPEDAWEVVVAETWTRPAAAPDGSAAELDDSVVVLRRR